MTDPEKIAPTEPINQGPNSTRRKALHLLANAFATEVTRLFNEDGEVWPVALLGTWNQATGKYIVSATGPTRRVPLKVFIEDVAHLAGAIRSTATLVAFTCLAGGDVSGDDLHGLVGDPTGVKFAELLGQMRSSVVVICTDHEVAPDGTEFEVGQSMVLPIEEIGGHRLVRPSSAKWERGRAALLDLVPGVVGEGASTTNGFPDTGMKPVVVN